MQPRSCELKLTLASYLPQWEERGYYPTGRVETVAGTDLVEIAPRAEE